MTPARADRQSSMTRTLDSAAYLRRLRLDHPGPPSVAGLHALHAAQVERIPYEALEIQLRRPTTIDPHDSAERILRHHRGGYCFHLNGAGLGDALHEPLPLHEGRYVQGPLTFGMRPSQAEPGGWRFDHDPRGCFAGMDFRAERATVADFAARHHHLSTSPESSFVQTSTVERRDGDGIDKLTGCVLRRDGLSRSSARTIETQEEWFDALADVFDLPLTDVDAPERARLWRRVYAAHEAWLAAAGAQ